MYARKPVRRGKVAAFVCLAAALFAFFCSPKAVFAGGRRTADGGQLKIASAQNGHGDFRRAGRDAAGLDLCRKKDGILHFVQNDKDYSITVAHQSRQWRWTERDFAFENAGIFAARDAGRRGLTYAEKRDNIRRARAAGFNAEQTAQYVFPALDAKLDVLGRAVDIPPTDAKLFFYPFNNAQCTTHNAQLKVNSKFVIEREKEGYRIDRKRFYADLLRAFLKSPAPSVGLKFEPVPAPVSAKALREFACFKSAFVTSFSGSGAERRENIRRSAASFNGRRLEPGEEFSFNKSTGPRTEERGYQEAKIILNGRFEKGSGGGVCQTSTTLYNAALLAGMQIVEAHRHSLPVSYVAPSFDAAVSGGAMDLRFANPGPGPVFIRSDFLEDTLRVELYGVKNPYRIERRSEKLQELTDYEDEFLVDTEGKYRDVAPYRGERVRVTYPKAGLVSKGYLRYYAGRKLVREVCVRNDRYAPQNGLTVEGTLERPAPPPEPAPPALLLPEIRKYDIMNPWGAYSLYSALSNSR